MIEVHASTNIDCLPVDLFDYLADFSNNSAWQAGVIRCTETSQPPTGQGSTFEHESSLFGRRVITRFEAVEFEPDYRISTKTATGSMPRDVISEISRRSDGGSRFRSTVRAEPKGWFLVFAFAARWGLRALVRGDCSRLKREMERGSELEH